MRAIRYHGRRDLRLEDVPDAPEPGPDDVRIRVEWCGVCGTDLEEWRSGPINVPMQPHALTGRMAPLTLGHEFAGVVESIGSHVAGLSVGDRVACDTLLFCGTCTACRAHEVTRCERLGALGLMADGGLADMCTGPARSFVRLPAGVETEAGALAEPLAVAVRALRRGRLTKRDAVVVVGGGTIGSLAAQVALREGCVDVVLVEPVGARRAMAVGFGIPTVVDVADAPSGSATLVVECSGTRSGVATALDAVVRGGRVVLVGVYDRSDALDPWKIVRDEIEVLGSLSHVYDVDFVRAVELLADGRIDVASLVTGRIPLSRGIEDGFAVLEREPERHVKILIGGVG